MGKSDTPKMQVTQYFASIHFGICHGPLDYISQILVQEKEAWSGQQAAQGEIYIDRDDLFGGTKKEGGVSGLVEYLPGGPTQTIPENLAAKAGRSTATMPAYRGIASAWFYEHDRLEEEWGVRGFYWSANSPYLPGVWIKVARASTALNEEHARIYRGLNGPISVYFLLDRSLSLSAAQFAAIKSAVNAGLDLLETFISEEDHRVDIGVRFYSTGSTAIERTDCDASDIADIRAFIAAATRVTGGQVDLAFEFIEDWFTATVDVEFSRRAVVFVTDTTTEDGMTAAAAGPAADMLDQHSGTFAGVNGTQVDLYAINYVSTDTTWTSLLDNTPQDGVPVITSSDESGLTDAVADVIRSREFDSNPAHIIYECLTNTSWGMGAAAAAIDTDSFDAAAATLYDEVFGLSLIWTQQSTIEAFVSEILDHIEATLFVSPRTGLLTLKLIRDDYSLTGLPEFTPDNSVVTKFSRKLWGETINEIVVTWTNPDNEEEETVVAQDLANISTQGGIVSDSRNYYGVRVKDLAMRLAQRDLRSAATPLASCDIEVNREAWALLPGDVVILNSPDDGIETLVMRVGPVDYGRPGDATVKASLVEDVWALAAAEYTVPPDTIAEETSEEPSPADFTLVFTLTYFDAANRVSAALAAGTEYPEVFAGVLAAEDGTDTAEFDLYGEVTDAGGNVTVEDLGTKTITSRATLAGAIAAEVETVIPAADFTGVTQGNGPSVGGFVLIEGDDEASTAGSAAHELCLVTAAGGSPSAWTLQRGVLDTIPRAWPAGTPVWFLDATSIFVDQTVRSEAETVDYQILPRTSLGTLALADAPIVSETLTARPHLPLRPADVTVNGDDGFSGVLDLIGVDPIPTAWARRNRLTEDAIVLAWDAADVTPEVGQTTTVRLTDLAGNTLHEYTGISGTSQNVDPADFGVEEEGYIEFVAVRDALESLQPYRVRVIVSGDPFQFEDGDIYEFEDGEPKLFEN